MFYEIEMIDEHLESCVQMMKGIENPENVIFDFCLNFQEYYEKIDRKAFSERLKLKSNGSSNFALEIGNIIQRKLQSIFPNHPLDEQINIFWKFGGDGLSNTPFYNIADYRRDLNNRYCQEVDFVLWGESDSLWPKQTLEIIEAIQEQVFESEGITKFTVSFADRKMWDASWDTLTHPQFKRVRFEDTDEWALNNPASGKSYMSLEQMNAINDIPLHELAVETFHQPKFDGSCLVISSDLIKSGINIPHSLLLAGEDSAFMKMCEIVLGSNYRQYHVSNILKVHNRRHPKKRMYILNENNPNGFCDERKGDWWNELTRKSKENLANLQTQFRFHKNG